MYCNLDEFLRKISRKCIVIFTRDEIRNYKSLLLFSCNFSNDGSNQDGYVFDV